MSTKRPHLLLSVLAVALLAVGGAGYYVATAERSSGPRFSAEEMNEGGLEDLGTLSMAEVEKRLNYLIDDSTGTLNTLEMLGALDLSLTVSAVSEVETAQDYQYEPLFVPYTSAQVAAALAAPQDLHFTQDLQGSRSKVRLDTDPLDAIWARAATPEQPAAAHYHPTHLYFRDGSNQALAEVEVQGEAEDDEAMPSSGEPIALPVGKPLAKLDLRLSYRAYPAFKTIVLDRDTPKVVLASGEAYQLTELADNSASLTLAFPRASSYVVQGLTEAGQALYNNGQNVRSLPSAQQIAALRAFHEALLQTQDELDQYPSGQEVQKHLEALAEPVEPGPLQQVSARYDFEATPQRIVIHVLDPLEEHQAQLELTAELPAQQRYIATDPESELAGFVDAAGSWLVKPRFLDAAYSDTPGLYRLARSLKPSDPDAEVQVGYYYFPSGSSEPKPLPFENIEQVINADLLLVQRETNGPYGIYDIKRHRFTLPMRFVHPTVTGNLITARIGEQTYGSQGFYGAYTLAGKEILPARYDEAAQIGDFLYASSQERSRRDVFDLQGNRINPRGYSAIAYFDGEQPLLVQHDSNKRYAFIDQQGDFLPFKLPYDEVSHFSSGMAVVSRDDRDGAIDLTGTLRIPLDYHSIQPFENDLAIAHPAEGAGGLVQIDKDNNWVKRLDTDSDEPSSSDAVDASAPDADALDYAAADMAVEAVGDATEVIDATEATEATEAVDAVDAVDVATEAVE